MVQLEGGFVRGHRPPNYRQQLREQEALQQQSLLDKLTQLWTKARPEGLVEENTGEPAEKGPVICACGCGQVVPSGRIGKTTIRGHHWRMMRAAKEAEKKMSDEVPAFKSSETDEAIGQIEVPADEAVKHPTDEKNEVPADEKGSRVNSGVDVLCLCGCGEVVAPNKRYRKGHYGRTVKGKKLPPRPIKQVPAYQAVKRPIADEVPAYQAVKPKFAEIDGPPAYPAPIDHRRWRLASERPGTPFSNPWIPTKCHVCLKPMWSRDPLSVWENGGMCEEDEYLLRSELADHGRKQFRQQQARAYYDPFRPR